MLSIQLVLGLRLILDPSVNPVQIQPLLHALLSRSADVYFILRA